MVDLENGRLARADVALQATGAPMLRFRRPLGRTVGRNYVQLRLPLLKNIGSAGAVDRAAGSTSRPIPQRAATARTGSASRDRTRRRASLANPIQGCTQVVRSASPAGAH